MGQSVEALLDPALEAAVRRQWDLLAEARLPSQARHTAPSNRPHLTLAYAQGLSAAAESAIAGLDWRIPLPIELGGLLAFTGQRHTFTLVRAVVPTRALLDLHVRLLAVLDGADGLSATSLPDAWTPHVTLARRLSAEQLGTAIGALGSRARTLRGAVVAVRRWDGDARHEWRVAGDGAGPPGPPGPPGAPGAPGPPGDRPGG